MTATFKPVVAGIAFAGIVVAGILMPDPRRGILTPDPLRPATAIPPMFAEIEPADGAVVRGTETWVRWSPSAEAEGRILWHKIGESNVQVTEATGSDRLVARLQPLELGE